MMYSEQLSQQIEWLQNIRANGVQAKIPELLYYRGKTRLLDLSPRIGNQAKLAGNYLAKSKGRGMEFDEVRHYQQGDDPRMIDWRVTARTGKTHTKLFREEKERPVFVLTDLTQSMHFGSQLMYKSVQASHLAALIAWHCNKRGDRLGGLVFNEAKHLELKPRTRQQGVLQYLHALELLSAPATHTATAQAFTDACARLRRLARPGALINIISDFNALNDQAVQHLSQLSRHCELIAYRIIDPLELQLPNTRVKQSLLVTDGDQQGELALGDQQFANQYQSEALQHLAKQQQALAKCRCRVIDISAGSTLEQQLQ